MFRNSYGSWIFTSSIFSQISNKRGDKYGGNLKNRSRLLLEISKEIRNYGPKKILGARVTGSDNLKGGIKIDDLFNLFVQTIKKKSDWIM